MNIEFRVSPKYNQHDPMTSKLFNFLKLLLFITQNFHFCILLPQTNTFPFTNTTRPILISYQSPLLQTIFYCSLNTLFNFETALGQINN